MLANTVRNVLLAPRLMVEHIRFFRRTRTLRLREVMTVGALSTLGVVSEAGGMTMILPILSFVERGRDVEAFARSSSLASAIVKSYSWVGVPVSLLSLCAVALLFVIVRQAISYFTVIEIERVKWNIGRRLAVRFFAAVLGSTATNIRTYKAGEFMTAADYECQVGGGIARVYATIWVQLLSLSAYGAVLVMTAPLASAVAGFVILCSLIGLGVLTRVTRDLSRIALEFRRMYANFLSERFRAWRLIKLGNTLKLEAAKADDLQARIVANQLRQLRVSGMLALVFVPVMSAVLLLMLYVFVEVLALDVATVVLFILVLVRITPISQSLQTQFNLLAQFAPAQERVSAALERASAHSERIESGRAVAHLKNEIRFDDVSFFYPDRDHAALEAVSVAIPAGRMTALIGPSGAGKSTFVDMIPRLITPDRGRITFDGTAIEEFSLGTLRGAIAYVPQEPFLFDASIADNIRYLRPAATIDEIKEAARLANASDFIEQTPHGYETALGDQGGTLSVGQKQRVVLARAFLSRAQILILDEPTSALDYESEAAIQRAIEVLVADKQLTVIVIAHRLSTIQNADFVVHLKAGRVFRTGPAQAVLGGVTDLPLATTGR